MKRLFLAVTIYLAANSAFAGQTDYFCWFGAEPASRVDSGVGAYWNTKSLAWDTSQTFIVAAASSGGALPGNFAIIVSRPAQDPILDADNQCGLVIDRDLLVAGQAGAVIASGGVATAVRTGMHFSPIPMGGLTGDGTKGYKVTGLGQ